MSDVPTSVRAPAFERLGSLVVRRKWQVLISYLVAMAAFGIFGSGVFSALQSEGFLNPTSDAATVATLLTDEFGVESPAAILLVESTQGVDSPQTQDEVGLLVADLEQTPGISRVVSYWTSGQPPQLLGSDGLTSQVLVYAAEGTQLRSLANQIAQDFIGQRGGLLIYGYGGPLIGQAFNDAVTEDLARAETFAIPITLILLLFIFGSVVSAGLPFLVAGGAILGSLLTLFFVSQVTDVSVFALNLITGLGLALGIDYSLLAINRFREGLASGLSTEEAVVKTVATAGKTVFVSGITVAVTLASLLFFPQYFLKSFAYAGIAVSLFAVVGSLTALPAVLAILGPRVNKLKVRRGELAPRDDGAWSRVARFVMRRPWPVLIGVLALLFVMAAPALQVTLGQVDDRALPPDQPVAIAGEVLRDRFPGYASSPYDVVLREPGSTEQVEGYAKALAALDGVVAVTTPDAVVTDSLVQPAASPASTSPNGEYIRISVIGDVPPIGPQGDALVASIRAVPAPADQAWVGGLAAAFSDAVGGITGRAPVVALWIGLATIVILFLYTGSVVLPIKAVLLNLLSLSATLGALVWVFQGNHLTWLTGNYNPTGSVDISTVALVAIVAFALSMDYELFLLSRIKEEHDAGRTTADAVALGLQRTGRIITAAALMIAIVFAAFLTSGVTNIKQLGFGVTFAILLDATIVRGLLVPAFMRIAGGANWWAPPWLSRLHSRFGLREG
jgi:RND superfamily putative drug exporter